MTANQEHDTTQESADLKRATAGFLANEISVEMPPSADDPYEVRAAWAREVVAQAAAQTIDQRSARVALPDDLRPSHFWEVEFQSALVDPIDYARSIRQSPRILN